MAQVPRDTVFFQSKTSDLKTVTRYVDLVLSIWCCVDNLQGRVADEVAYLRKERKKDLFDDGFEDNPIKLLMVAATRMSGDNDEASDQERLLRGVLSDIRYQANLGAMNQVGIFLENLLDDTENWRSDSTKTWELNETNYEDLFCILVWMVLEFEEIIKAFFERRPLDTNMLLYLENLRKNFYREAASLESLASERSVFHRILGTGQYFVSDMFATFWHAIEHHYEETIVAENPIDERLTERTRLMTIFSQFDDAISSRLTAEEANIPEHMYLSQLRQRLSRVSSVWESVFGGYFFLGPTKKLLLKTKELFAEFRPLLEGKDEGLSDNAKPYRDSIVEYLQKFDEAADVLLGVLSALEDDQETVEA